MLRKKITETFMDDVEIANDSPIVNPISEQVSLGSGDIFSIIYTV